MTSPLTFDFPKMLWFFLMASTSRASPDDDGYKRFTEDIHNVSYGSNCSSKYIFCIVCIITVILSVWFIVDFISILSSTLVLLFISLLQIKWYMVLKLQKVWIMFLCKFLFYVYRHYIFICFSYLYCTIWVY